MCGQIIRQMSGPPQHGASGTNQSTEVSGEWWRAACAWDLSPASRATEGPGLATEARAGVGRGGRAHLQVRGTLSCLPGCLHLPAFPSGLPRRPPRAL